MLIWNLARLGYEIASLIGEWINLVLQHLFWYGNFLHNLWFQICGQDMAWCLLLFRWGSLFQLIGFPDHGKLYQWSASASGGRPGSRRTSAPCWHSTWGFVGGCRWSAWQPEDFFGGVKTTKNGGGVSPSTNHGTFSLLKFDYFWGGRLGVQPFEDFHWISWVVEIYHWELDG